MVPSISRARRPSPTNSHSPRRCERQKIVVDLSEVSFLSSIGIRLLLTSARGQAQRGGKLILTAPQPCVRGIIEAAGIDKLIALVADLDAARAALAD